MSRYDEGDDEADSALWRVKYSDCVEDVTALELEALLLDVKARCELRALAAYRVTALPAQWRA